MALTPRHLLRLYPGLWRLRYGGEFLALLETTLITPAVVIDVLRAAAREWVARTRVGRLLLGCVVAQIATMCAFGLAALAAPERLLGAGRIDSLQSLIIAMLSGFAPVWVGAALVTARTRRDRRYAWLGLRHQLVLLCLAAVWAEYVGLGYAPESRLVWYSAAASATLVTWMLLLLFNVDRRREEFSAWRRFERPIPRLGSIGIGSDRY